MSELSRVSRSVAPAKERAACGHATFAFPKPGLYKLTVEATGTQLVDGAISSSATYQVAVATPVPEPTRSLWGLAALGFAGVRRFRTRRDPVQPR